MIYTDAQAMKRKHPKTFYAPGETALAKIKPGSVVKVGMKCGGRYATGERMWAKVTSVKGGSISATLMNDPVVCTRLKWGSRIRFNKKNVMNIQGRGR